MWDIGELKTSAKAVLKDNYWKAFFVSLVLMFSNIGRGSNSRSNDLGDYIRSHPEYFLKFVIILILVLVYRIFVGYSLEVGSKKYYVQLSQYKNTQGCYGFAFDSENYKGIISSMFLSEVYVLLWTLVLIIPGIVKSFSYLMVPYILADNPRIGADEAITLSRKMMDGNKFGAFVLGLSFIGWYILGLLAFFVGIIFVNPYCDATFAQLYLVLRGNALDNEICSYEDLNISRANFEYDEFEHLD